MKEKQIEGISIRKKDTKELIELIKCPVGTRQSLKVLSGVRQQINQDDYIATEDLVTQKEYDNIKE